jgi:protein transport protein SEC31
MQRVKAVAPATYKNHVDDAEKRLNLLFDQLNSGSYSADGLARLKALTEALQARNYDEAQGLHGTLAQYPELSAVAMVGVKRLISMSRATPVS